MQSQLMKSSRRIGVAICLTACTRGSSANTDHQPSATPPAAAATTAGTATPASTASQSRLAGTHWRLVEIQSMRRQTTGDKPRRQSEIHDRLRQRACLHAARLQSRRGTVRREARCGRWRQPDDRAARRHSSVLPGTVARRSHRARHGARALISNREWPTRAQSDGGRRHLCLGAGPCGSMTRKIIP